MTPSLYQLTTEFRAQAEKLADLDLDETTLRDTLESMSGELEAKARNVAAFCRELEAHAASIKDAEAQMARRRKTIEGRAASIRKYLLDSMQFAGIHKIESPYLTLCVKQNPAAVEIFDERQVPPEFTKIPEPPAPTPDKTAIRAAIKAGIEVPGCRLSQGVRLEIA